MEQTWRWYSSNDPVSLADVHQTGVTGVITVLHHISDGEVWPMEEILKCETIVEDVGLVWSVVESVPIHEDIRTHIGNYKQRIVNYQRTLHNLTQCGIRTMCYNFIPVLDWIRTGPEYVLPGGSKVLRFDQIEFAVSEMHILKCPGAEVDYIEEETAQAAVRFATMSDEDKARLVRNIIAGLPGAEEGHALDRFCKHLELYKDTDKVKLRGNSAVSLKAVIPITEEVGVRMATHPDDPPHPILGLSRIVSITGDMQWMVDTINSVANGSTMRTGSYGVCANNDLIDMIKQLGPRIYSARLHSTMCEDNPKTSHETVHLNGDVDIYEAAKAIAEEGHRHKAEDKKDPILIRPGRGHQTPDDLKKKTNPGHSTIGRLKGLVEVRGVELAVQRTFSSH